MDPPAPNKIHTYHCLCSTLLLATPYDLLPRRRADGSSFSSSSLPRRAPPALDRAYILPLPLPPNPTDPNGGLTRVVGTDDNTNNNGGTERAVTVLPSLLTAHVRPGRKVVVVRREDGFERRRVWRCGRCGVGVWYEVLREGGDKGGGGGRVVYLVEGGLVETGEMGRGEDGEDGDG